MFKFKRSYIGQLTLQIKRAIIVNETDYHLEILHDLIVNELQTHMLKRNYKDATQVVYIQIQISKQKNKWFQSLFQYRK